MNKDYPLWSPDLGEVVYFQGSHQEWVEALSVAVQVPKVTVKFGGFYQVNAGTC